MGVRYGQGCLLRARLVELLPELDGGGVWLRVFSESLFGPDVTNVAGPYKTGAAPLLILSLLRSKPVGGV